MSQLETTAGSYKGRFVASNKRMYSEYVFDLYQDDNGKTCKRKPARRGPLSASTRQGIEDVKAGGGACWRCKILKKPCDNKFPCTQCASTKGKSWQLECQRGNLHDRLKDLTLCFPGLGSSEWFLPTTAGFSLGIRVRYDSPEYEIHDINLPKARCALNAQAKDSLYGFLKQFHNNDSPLLYFYGDTVVAIIKQCAKIQEDILYEAPLTPGHVSEDVLIIALALRAFALVRSLTSVTTHLYWEAEPEAIGTFLQPTTFQRKNNSIEIWKCFQKPRMVSTELGINNDRKLELIIQEIIRRAQRMLFQRSAKDWPSLIYVLCLLCLIEEDFGIFIPSWAALKSNELGTTRHLLCELYDACTKGFHPLTSDWDRDGYASLVGGNQHAVARFTALNEIWVKKGIDEDLDPDTGFETRMRRLLFTF